MDKFKNKYRIPSARAAWWDYSNSGRYFITICTAGREHYFGEIINGEMMLSKIGEFASSCWLDIPNHFSFVKLGESVIMPNHVHGIVIIDNNFPDAVVVETLHATSLPPPPPSPPSPPPPPSPPSPPSPPPPPKNEKMMSISPKRGSLGSVIRSYKTAVTTNAHLIHYGFGWQSRFHDHIIRDDDEYKRISNYIANNPDKWNEDKFFTNE